MYRFLDQKGRTLALRADFTPQMARMAATKLFDQPMPLRCSYVGSLFRYEEPQAGRKREFTQAGIELIGADTAEADAEVVALAIAALKALDLRSFQVNLGQMAFFRSLTRGLPGKAVVAVRDAIDHKNQARLLEALDQAGLTGNQARRLKRLPALTGGPGVLEEARELSAGLTGNGGTRESEGAGAALERLAEVYRLLQAYGVADRVILDLSEVRGMNYYTGITFRGVAPGLGWPVLSGGRYDELIARFGRPLAAIGFGIGIERALLIQSHQGVPVPSPAPHLLVHGCDHAACLALLRRLRETGCRVELDVLGFEGTTLIDQARRRDIQRVLRCCGDKWKLWDGDSERDIAGEDVLREAARWASAGHADNV
jgi:ATP phosphoribosyltransferase regulatory subunit